MENSLNEPAQEYNDRMLKKTSAATSETTTWSCSNNNNSESSTTTTAKHIQQQQEQQQRWKRKVSKPLRAFCEVVGVSTNCNKQKAATPTTSTCTVSGAESMISSEGFGGGGGEERKIQQNGTGSTNSRHNIHKSCAYVDTAQTQPLAVDMWTLSNTNTTASSGDPTCDNDCFVTDVTALAVAGAASLTPPENSHSNRTSMNNSTENLSYSSYPDDLILLDDDDVDGEEISLNSDDCVYAYRGDGADYDIDVDAFASRSGCDVGGLMDDETDFLEMDFEPDPLSEIEFGFMEMPVQLDVQPNPNDAFLLQRDSCHLSGRHSASLQQSLVSPSPRQLFSSPIDDLPPPPKALQSQALLSKHFARISLHLDQIKGETSECDYDMRTRNDCLCLSSVVGGPMDGVDLTTATTQSSAHSLPSGLHASFGECDINEVEEGDEEEEEEKETKISPTKITGAKPKRLSTFSSSSTSSKNSSKSRTSLRSAYAPALCGSSSFDERSVSCTEFTSSAGNIHGPSAPPTSTEDCLLSSVASMGCDDFYATEDFCLDCLEKEFLANTIGKAPESSECARCRRRSGVLSGNSLHRAYLLGRSTESTRCRSGSPTSFLMEVRDDCLFGSDATHEFLQTHRHNKRANWLANASAKSKRRDGLTKGRAEQDLRRLNWNESCEGDAATLEMNQRRSTCDNYNGEQLLKNFLLTEPETVTISTVNLTEETLVQALDKLHIAYNIEMLQSYFRSQYINSNSDDDSSATKLPLANRDFKSIKHLLLHESKKFVNHKKLKHLIEMATCQRINVHFKPDTSITHTEIVAVKVADILHQWTRTNNLELLKQLDKRFVKANVLGKIANIIRQAQQQRGNTTRRTLPEFIYIPQYYATGFLALSKKK